MVLRIEELCGPTGSVFWIIEDDRAGGARIAEVDTRAEAVARIEAMEAGRAFTIHRAEVLPFRAKGAA
jgi:hypothetical protein